MTSERQRIYLAYGSNLHPRRLEARIGEVRLLGIVSLPGWALRFNKRGGDGSAKANLHPQPGSEATALTAAYALQPEQVSRLDVFEGCGRGYETLPINVTLDGKRLDAFTYLVPSQWMTSRLLPFDWYVDLIVSGARHHAFGSSYVSSIAEHPTCKDCDHERARRELREMELPLRDHYKR